MHVTLRSLLPGLLLLAAVPASRAQAQEAWPDPVPPAVVGRPLPWLLAPPVTGRHATGKAPRAKHGAPQRAGGKQAATAAARPGTTQQASATAHPPKSALDDRVDSRMRLDDVGKGTHFARKATQSGSYFVNSDRNAVQQYFAGQPVPGAPAPWKIGEPLPRGATVAAVPKGLVASMSPVPPGHRYVQVGGDVLLVDGTSKMVVDAISRSGR